MYTRLIRKIIRKITTRKFRSRIYSILTGEARRRKRLRKEILEEYNNSNDKEINEITEYLKIHKLEVFNYDFINKYNDREIEVLYDDKAKMHYVYHDKKRLYFKRKLNTKEAVEVHYNSLCLEQDMQSPHKYTWNKQKKYKCVLDVGAAEGIFALDIIDNVEEIFLFEVEENWIEALEYTFAPYKEKVHIIKKYVSDKTNEQEIRLDDFFKNINKEIEYLKIDIEGAELMLLEGAAEIINKNPIEINICAYHKQDDEVQIREFLKEFNITANGFMVFYYDKSHNVSLRRGVLHCSKK